MERYRQAMVNKDLATVDRLWSDDFTFINPRGEQLSKAKRLENMRTERSTERIHAT